MTKIRSALTLLFSILLSWIALALMTGAFNPILDWDRPEPVSIATRFLLFGAGFALFAISVFTAGRSVQGLLIKQASSSD